MKKLISVLIIFVLLLPCATVLAAEGEAELAIDTQHVYPGMNKSYAQGYMPAVAGNTANVVLPLVTSGDGVCDSVKASIDLGDPSAAPFVFKNYVNEFGWDTYALTDGSASCYLITFSLELKNERFNGSYPVVVHVAGKTRDGNVIAGDFTLYVVIDDRHAAGQEAQQEPRTVPQPRLLVEAYECDPSPLEAGVKAALTVTVRNTSASQTVENIKLSFQDQSGEILPAAAGSVYIERIKKGQSAECSFDIRVAADASARAHVLTVTMEYENGEAAPFSSSDIIVLDVAQRIRLEYEQPTLPAKVTEGDNIAFSMNIMNLGKSAVYNVLLKFEIPGLNNGGSVLAGNILPGESKQAATNLLASSVDGEYGEVSGNILLSYESESGERFERDIEVHTRIDKKIAPASAGPQKSESKDEDSLPWWAWGAGGVVIIAAAGLLSVKMIKSKRQRELDERNL